MKGVQLQIGWPSKRRAANGPRFAEFFAGIGLVRMGLEAAGWRLAYANDIDSQKMAMYDGHFGDAGEHFVLSDIHNLRSNDIPDIELATASFPCTDLSLAGARLGLDRGPQSSAFWGFVRLLKGMGSRRPPLVMLENVLGFITSNRGRDFRSAISALNDLGYAADVFSLDAKWFVPQSRVRLFVIGSAAGPRAARALQSRVRPPVVVEFIKANPELSWRIHELPEPPSSSRFRLVDVLDDPPEPGPRWWDRERSEYFYNQLSDRHRAIADAMIAKRRWSYATAFRRVRPQPAGGKRSMAELRTDGLAGCLRTPKGGSGRQILFRAGYGRYATRLLTPRECARLMGADDFAITVPDNEAYFGFGDAVCVPAISWIAEHCLIPALLQQQRERSALAS